MSNPKDSTEVEEQLVESQRKAEGAGVSEGSLADSVAVDRLAQADNVDNHLKELENAVEELLEKSAECSAKLKNLLEKIEKIDTQIHNLCELSGVRENSLKNNSEESIKDYLETTKTFLSRKSLLSIDSNLLEFLKSKKPSDIVTFFKNLKTNPAGTIREVQMQLLQRLEPERQLNTDLQLQQLHLYTVLTTEAERLRNIKPSTWKEMCPGIWSREEIRPKWWLELRAKRLEKMADNLLDKREWIQDEWIQYHIKSSPLSFETLASWCASALSWLPVPFEVKLLANPINLLVLWLTTKSDLSKMYQESLNTIEVEDILKSFGTLQRRNFDLDNHRKNNKNRYNRILVNLTTLVERSKDMKEELAKITASLKKEPKLAEFTNSSDTAALEEFQNIVLKLAIERHIRSHSDRYSCLFGDKNNIELENFINNDFLPMLQLINPRVGKTTQLKENLKNSQVLIIKFWGKTEEVHIKEDVRKLYNSCVNVIKQRNKPPKALATLLEDASREATSEIPLSQPRLSSR